jgi:hypothetical protein
LRCVSQIKAQQDALAAEIAKQPLVSHTEACSELAAEYSKNPLFLRKIEVLPFRRHLRVTGCSTCLAGCHQEVQGDAKGAR